MTAILATTPSQTVGPFFSFALPWSGGARLYGDATLGERIAISGKVFDGDRLPVVDALVEIWQANASGRYAHEEDTNEERPLDPAFLGFGRCPTDVSGNFAFETIRPGRVDGPNGTLQAPHIVAGIFARGLLKRLVTRIYFSDSVANADDMIMLLVEPMRRERLIANRVSSGFSRGTSSAIEGTSATADGANAMNSDASTIATYHFDIVLQGAGESVFFAC